MRTHLETAAMAMLLLIDPEWKSFQEHGVKYPAHDALSRVTKTRNEKVLREPLDFDVDAWQELRETAQLYNHQSHAGALTAMMHVKWTSQLPVYGGEFDPA